MSMTIRDAVDRNAKYAHSIILAAEYLNRICGRGGLVELADSEVQEIGRCLIPAMLQAAHIMQEATRAADAIVNAAALVRIAAGRK